MEKYHRYKPRDFFFGQRLLLLRQRTGLTQEELARKIGVADKTIRNWEGGSYYPSDIHLRKLTEVYLTQEVFASGKEEDEVRALWSQLRESTSHRTGIFDEQWFVALFTEWQTRHISQQPLSGRRQQPESPVFSQQHPLLMTESDPQDMLPSSRLFLGDWSGELDMSSLYGRTDELAELEHWLLVDRCRLVAVLGMGGIGKTALVSSFVQQVAPHFACVLWRSLQNAPPLQEVLHDWLQILATQPLAPFPQEVDQTLPLVIRYLQERRCLLVLDNLETLLQEGSPQGHFREGFEGYATFIRSIARTTHQSCLLLTSRELFTDLLIFPGRQAPVRVLRPGGLAVLACQHLLQDKDLFGDQEAWSDLVQRYMGNPLALKIVAETVRELFGGDIAAFLAEGFLSFHEIRQLLKEQFERLSLLEQELMYWLAIERELTSLEMLKADLMRPISTSELVEALQALRSRSLVERGEPGAVFTLQPAILEYVTERLIALVSEEIRDSRPMLMLQHDLLQAQTRDYLRTSQAQLILKPVLDRLLSHFGGAQQLEAHLESLLSQLRRLPQGEQGYGGGNIINLQIRLSGHVKGRDYSQLTVWQADLREVEGQAANFAESDLSGSVFLETLDGICSVAFSPNGDFIAAGTTNGQISVWRTLNGQPVLVLSGHHKMVWSLLFNPESAKLISGDYDGLVKVWEIGSGQCTHILRGHTRWIGLMALHPEGRLLATCSDDRSIRLWDLETGHCLRVWPEQHHEVWSVAFSPDGNWLASSYGDGLIKLWDLSSEECLWSIAAHHGSAASSLAFSPDGQLLVSGGEDTCIMVWQASTGKQLSTLTAHSGAVQSVAFNAQGVLASSSFDCTVRLWQLSRIGQTGVVAQCVDTLHGHTGWVWSIAFGPDERLVSGSFDCTVKLWQLSRTGKGGKCLRTLRGYSHLINRVVLSPDGRLLLSDECSGMVRLWDARSGKSLRVFPKQVGEFSALAFSPDGRCFAQGLPDHTIKLWEVEHGKLVRTLSGHQREICAVTFSTDGRFLLSGSVDSTVRLWEVESGRCLMRLQGHNRWVWLLACSPDGRRFASADTVGVVKIWETGSGKCLQTLYSSCKAIQALTFTPDGRRLLSSNAQELVVEWDVQSGDRLRVVPGNEESYWLGSVAFSADSSLLATADSDQCVRLWEVSSGTLLRSFPCSPAQPCSVAFSTEQNLLACGTDGGSILLWERQTGRPHMSLRSDRPYERMNISGVRGITEAQKASLRIHGAIEDDQGQNQENM